MIEFVDLLLVLRNCIGEDLLVLQRVRFVRYGVEAKWILGINSWVLAKRCDYDVRGRCENAFVHVVEVLHVFQD